LQELVATADIKINSVVVICPISIQLRLEKKQKCMMEEKQMMAPDGNTQNPGN
jgi:hypothetical protein